MHPIFTLLANRRKQGAAVMASHDNVTDLYGDVALNSSDQHRVGFAGNSHANIGVWRRTAFDSKVL